MLSARCCSNFSTTERGAERNKKKKKKKKNLSHVVLNQCNYSQILSYNSPCKDQAVIALFSRVHFQRNVSCSQELSAWLSRYKKWNQNKSRVFASKKSNHPLEFICKRNRSSKDPTPLQCPSASCSACSLGAAMASRQSEPTLLRAGRSSASLIWEAKSRICITYTTLLSARPDNV